MTTDAIEDAWKLTEYREALELALAVAAHERMADKTGRHGWHQTESMLQTHDPSAFTFPTYRCRIPIEFAEWCWPL